MSKVMKTGRTVINPLDSIQSSESLESVSAGCGSRPVVDNTRYGYCPKCSEGMGIVKNAKSKDMFFCASCSVSLPCKEC